MTITTRRRVMAITHNHLINGASLCLHQLIEHQRRRFEFSVGTITPQDGPMRARWQALDVPVVQVINPADHDVVLCNTLPTLRQVVQLGPQLPVVWWLHEGWVGLPILERSGIASQAFAAARAVVCVADFQRDTVYRPWLAGRPESVHVVPNTTELALRDPARQRRPAADGDVPFQIVSVGGLQQRKGPDVLAQALNGSNPAQVQARLIGDAQLAPPALLAALSSHPCLTLTGELPAAEVVEAIAQADVLCLPSRDEAHPLVVLEAMALGTPVVASALPGLTPFLTHGVQALLSPPGDWRMLRGHLEMLRADPALRLQLAQQAQTTYRQRFHGQRPDETIARLLATVGL
jgi:glycosyltransferase involved in cell wall biosynthesis